MLLPDELAAKSVIPALRSLVAKKLIRSHGLTQIQAADRLDLTQAAISNYMRRARGIAFNLEEIPEVDRIASEIAGALTREKVDKRQIIARFEEVSLLVKSRKLMCTYHQHLEPQLDLTDCDACNPGELVQITVK